MPRDQKSLSTLCRFGQVSSVILGLCFSLFTLACGSSPSSSAAGNGGGGVTPTTTTPTTATQIKIGDAPADRVVSFEVTVGPITLTPGSGSAVTVLSGTRRLELAHLSGANEPLALLQAPQGSYNSASLTVSNPQVTYINNLGVLAQLEPAFNQAITVNFNPALTVGVSAAVVNIDLNIANSLTFDSQGNVTGVSISASSFTMSAAAVAAEDKQGHEDGELEDTTGTITAVNGSSFTMTVGQNGASLTFATDANTEFNDGATLTANTIVTVEGVTRADGSLYAKEVEGIEDSTGVEAEGMITNISGTQVSLLADDGVGGGMDDTKVGGSLSADMSTTKYKVNKGNIDTSGIGNLPAPPTFPFDASTVHAGQRIEVDSSAPLSGSGMTAENIKLQQQALVGTVSGLEGATSAGPVTFTLTVPSDSAFAMVSGKTQVSVYWQPGTDLHKLATLNNGDAVRVRGLVFFTGTAFNMIARRIDQ